MSKLVLICCLNEVAVAAAALLAIQAVKGKPSMFVCACLQVFCSRISQRTLGAQQMWVPTLPRHTAKREVWQAGAGSQDAVRAAARAAVKAYAIGTHVSLSDITISGTQV